MDRDWTVMDFARSFEDYQVERIRRAIADYRSRHNVGDVTLTKELLRFLPSAVTYDSALKNLQRLRKGENLRGATFLNACVQFLEVQMINPPEEELGLAMKRFVGDIFGFADLLLEIEGDYALQVLGERKVRLPDAFRPKGVLGQGVTINLKRNDPKTEAAPMVLTVSRGEGLDYGIVQERYHLPGDDPDADPATGTALSDWLSRKGVCLPIGGHDMLVLIRDFLFSHMYVLRRETFGFSGTMIVPGTASLLTTEVVEGRDSTQFDVLLRRYQWPGNDTREGAV
jgi:hypothetical protein